jgi:hypothetical protein
MTGEMTLTSAKLRTPKAAAVAGIVFSPFAEPEIKSETVRSPIAGGSFRSRRRQAYALFCRWPNREVRTAIAYTTATIRSNPNIARTRGKFADSGSTNSAGTNDAIAMIVSEIQCGIGLARSGRS